MTIKRRKAILLLKNIQVENANAIAGLTYGFPAITHFLGFTHALSRQLSSQRPTLKLGGCAVISHAQQIHAQRKEKDSCVIFSLTRNPLTKEAKPAPFVEEGRMHMTVSLLIECFFESADLNKDPKEFTEEIQNWVLMKKLAGGMIVHVEKIFLKDVPADYEAQERFTRQIIHQLLPGFILVERSQLLADHFQLLKTSQPDIEMMDAWLDFIALRSRPEPLDAEEQSEHTKTAWHTLPKPGKGWLVPIMAGYRDISDLLAPGTVSNVRDRNIPCRFVEAVYTIGQWLSPHRIKELSEIFWRYQSPPEQDWYVCKNEYETYNSSH